MGEPGDAGDSAGDVAFDASGVAGAAAILSRSPNGSIFSAESDLSGEGGSGMAGADFWASSLNGSVSANGSAELRSTVGEDGEGAPFSLLEFPVGSQDARRSSAGRRNKISESKESRFITLGMS